MTIVGCTEVGRDNDFHPGVVIGSEPQDKKFEGEETWVRIGDGNSLREHVTVHRGTQVGGGVTRIGNDCLIMAGAHIAHDCIVGSHVTMANHVLLGGHVIVEDFVGCGGLTAVHHFVTIGKYAFLGGMTRVTRDAVPYMITEGHPARVRTINRVGLRRNGISEEATGWLKEAHRLLFFEGMVREEACEKLAERGPIPPEGDYLLKFLKRAEDGNQGRALQP